MGGWVWQQLGIGQGSGRVSIVGTVGRGYSHGGAGSSWLGRLTRAGGYREGAWAGRGCDGGELAERDARLGGGEG